MSRTTDDELIESLLKLRRALPSLRLGQLIANMATVARGPVAGAVWDAEDEELLSAMRWQLQELAARSQEAANPGASPDRGTNGTPGSAPQQPPRQVS
jgi:hypothetical protein